MQSHIDYTQLDSKARRKLEDQRRMQFRRAIEERLEARRLQAIDNYPDLIAINYLNSARSAGRSARPAG